MRAVLVLMCALALAACSSGENDDLRSWMNEQARGMRGKVKPLPEVKQFALAEYVGASADDPFRAGRMEVEKAASMALRPDLDRRKEPLEAYPLESLRMVGVLSQAGSNHALVSAGDNLHQVRIGNYMGQDFGMVTGISETEISLKILVQDAEGDWMEEKRTLVLQEQQEAKK